MGIIKFLLITSIVCAVVAAVPFKSHLVAYKYTDSTRIIGGQLAERRQFPYQASLHRHGKHHCGGTLIHPKWVLTAAHCVESPFGFYEVYLGMLNQNERHQDVQNIMVRKLVLHEEYEGQYANDVALLELESPADLTEAVKLARLPNDEHCNRIGNSILSGWGDTLPDSSVTPERLNWISQPRITNEKCKENMLKLLGTYHPLDDNMICTVGNPGQLEASCDGDSGGPLVVNGDRGEAFVIGTASWTLKPCGTDLLSPSGYMNVCKYREFIHKHINNK